MTVYVLFQSLIQALRYLGFKPTEEEQHELRQRLPVDRGGFVSYGGKNSKKKRLTTLFKCSFVYTMGDTCNRRLFQLNGRVLANSR